MIPTKKVNGDAAAYTSHEPPAPDERTEVKDPEVATDMPTRVPRDYTPLPNWLMPILFTVLFVFCGFVYTTVDRRIEDKQKAIDKLEERLQLQETYSKNSREWLIGHGWDVDEQGHVTKAIRKK